MAGLAVTAVVSALVAFGVAALLGQGSPPPAPPAPPVPRQESIEPLRAEVARLRAEVAALRAGRPEPPPGTAAPPPAAGEAPAPATEAELVALIDRRIAARPPAEAAPGPARKTLDEAGAELGLSSVDIDSVKRIWRESEMEALTAIMGTADMEAIKEEVKAAEDDPDRKAALVNKVVGNMVRNLGRIATIEDRRNRELKKFLSEDQVKKLKGMDIKPTMEDADLEGILKGTFGD
jgi:hypothetical protein